MDRQGAGGAGGMEPGQRGRPRRRRPPVRVVNPSGKVPTSYPRSEADALYAGHPERYPGVDEGAGYPVIRYSEGLEIGYRWFQAQGIEPLFGFGFGLSYTTFDIKDVSVDAPDGANVPVTVTGSVTNTGPVAGAEVVQVYLGVPGEGQPPKRLVGFHKVFLEAGESQTVRMTPSILPRRAIRSVRGTTARRTS